MSREVSEDSLQELRRRFGPAVASKIEKWTLDVSYPESTLQVVLRYYHDNLSFPSPGPSATVDASLRTHGLL